MIAFSRRAVRRAIALARPRDLVLVYHRVAELEDDRWDLSVRPQHFAEHLAVLRRHAEPASLGALAHERRPRGTRHRVALTFDDGYADNLTQAKPILTGAEVPVTIFITTGVVSAGREFWWDELMRLSTAAQMNRSPGIESDATSLDYDILWGQLRDASPVERENALDGLAASAGIRRETRESHRPLTAAELTELVDGGLVEVGAHTVNHARLASLDLPRQRAEVVESAVWLEELLARPVRAFAYPFGRVGDYTDETVRVVREAGFAVACVNHPGAVGPRTDRLRLPRVSVRDWPGDEFERRLVGWLAGGLRTA
ncbi:MAG TPA: polysaccharide deacetylase family protein [Acidimicrobiales bacterium]|nr:polysaccharide deacetylase family protein [Acidimicrobiales bacterium]